MTRELTTFEKKVAGPLDAGLLVATLCYGVGYFGLKWLHTKLLANLLVAETQWAANMAALGSDTWSDEDYL